ncbi:MAG: TolC family protein [Deltaproteobacteria bacterium]|nr:TolC family protein [Deltaproteobacteria bacterium]
MEPKLPAPLEPATLGARALPELVDEAHRRRPDLAATRSQIDVAEGVLDVALGDYAPRLDVAGNYYTHRDGTLEDVDWDVTADLSVPIFEGLRTTTHAREAQSQKRQAELFYEGQARAIAKDVTAAYHSLRASSAARTSREETARSAEENFRLLEAEYRLGLASNLELVTAQQQLTQARLELENERLDEQRLAYELAFLLGGLDDETGEPSSPPAPP